MRDSVAMRRWRVPQSPGKTAAARVIIGCMETVWKIACAVAVVKVVVVAVAVVAPSLVFGSIAASSLPERRYATENQVERHVPRVLARAPLIRCLCRQPVFLPWEDTRWEGPYGVPGDHHRAGAGSEGASQAPGRAGIGLTGICNEPEVVLQRFVTMHGMKTLNVAGSRESKEPVCHIACPPSCQWSGANRVGSMAFGVLCRLLCYVPNSHTFGMPLFEI